MKFLKTLFIESILLVILSSQLINAQEFHGKMDFQGYLETKLKYTPEQQWDGQNRIQLYSQVAVGDKIKLYLNLGGWLPKYDQIQNYFSSPAYIGGQFAIRQAYVKIPGPLFPGDNEKTMILIGDTPINYSPYTVKLDRWDLEDVQSPGTDYQEYWNPIYTWNRIHRGINIETEFKKVRINTFGIWDNSVEMVVPAPGQSPQPVFFPGRLAYGFKVGPYNNKLNIIYATYLGQAQINSANAWERIYKLEERDSVTALETSLPLSRVTTLKGTHAFHYNIKNGRSSNAYADDFALQFNWAPEVELAINYRRIDANYDPRYRDRTPRFDRLGRKLSWNLIDKYRDKKGLSAVLKVKLSPIDLEISQEKYKFISNGQRDWTRQEIGLNSSLNGLQLGLSYWGETWDSLPNELGIITKIVDQNIDLDMSRDYFHNWGKTTFTWQYQVQPGFRGTTQSTFRINNFLNQPKGMLIYGGTRDIKRITSGERKRQILFGLEYTMPSGLQLKGYWATPNWSEEGDYDEEGNKIWRDNLFEVYYKTNF